MTATFSLGLFIGIVIYAVYVAFRCRFQVSEGYLAALSAFGKSDFVNEAKKELRVYGPGFHFKLPWQEVHTVSVMEQMLDLSSEESGTTAIAADGTLLSFDSVVRFTPLKESIYYYLFGLEHQLEHLKGLFACLLRNEIAKFDSQFDEGTNAKTTQRAAESLCLGSYALIRSERRFFNQQINEYCRHQIGDRYGISLDGIDLTDISAPDELDEVLSSIINAHSEVQSLLSRTKGECNQQIVAAAKGLDIAKARAAAVEQEISTMIEILARLQDAGTLTAYLERRRAEVDADARTSYIKRPK